MSIACEPPADGVFLEQPARTGSPVFCRASHMTCKHCSALSSSAFSHGHFGNLESHRQRDALATDMALVWEGNGGLPQDPLSQTL